MKKVGKTYRYDADVLEHAENNPEIRSFPEFCCMKYREEFMSLEKELKLLEKHSKIVDTCKANIEHLKNVGEHSMFKSEEKLWILEIGIDVFRNFSERGAVSRFNNHFGRSVRIGQFRRVVDHLEETKKANIKEE